MDRKGKDTGNEADEDGNEAFRPGRLGQNSIKNRQKEQRCTGRPTLEGLEEEGRTTKQNNAGGEAYCNCIVQLYADNQCSQPGLDCAVFLSSIYEDNTQPMNPLAFLCVQGIKLGQCTAGCSALKVERCPAVGCCREKNRGRKCGDDSSRAKGRQRSLYLCLTLLQRQIRRDWTQGLQEIERINK
eukprot:1156126-Pelagomonas_calceolata.AAC.6